MDNFTKFTAKKYLLLLHDSYYLGTNPNQIKETQGTETDKFDVKRISIVYRDGWLKNLNGR